MINYVYVWQLRAASENQNKLEGKDSYISISCYPAGKIVNSESITPMKISTEILRNIIDLQIEDLKMRLEKLGVKL